MHELGDLEIARVAQAAWTALSYILPNHEPIKAWANLPDTERAVMLAKIRDIIGNGKGPGRITGISEMNLEDARKHIVVASIVEALKLSDKQIETIMSWEAECASRGPALGNDNASNLVPMDSKLTPGHEGATENESPALDSAQGESRAEFEHDRFGTAGPTGSDEPKQEVEAVKP